MNIADIIGKAKEAKSAEALLSLARENEIELTEEQAKAYFAQMNKTGELADDELANVAGGQCKNGDKYVVIATTTCEEWKCPECGGGNYDSVMLRWMHDCKSTGKTGQAICNNCAHCTYERGLWLCDNTDFWDNQKWML